MLTTDFLRCCPHFHSLFDFHRKNDEKYRKMTKKKREWKRGQQFSVTKWHFSKKRCEHDAHNHFFIFYKLLFCFLGFFFDGNLEIPKNGKKFCSKNFSFFTCEHYAQKINLRKTVCY